MRITWSINTSNNFNSNKTLEFSKTFIDKQDSRNSCSWSTVMENKPWFYLDRLFEDIIRYCYLQFRCYWLYTVCPEMIENCLILSRREKCAFHSIITGIPGEKWIVFGILQYNKLSVFETFWENDLWNIPVSKHEKPGLGLSLWLHRIVWWCTSCYPFCGIWLQQFPVKERRRTLLTNGNLFYYPITNKTCSFHFSSIRRSKPLPLSQWKCSNKKCFTQLKQVCYVLCLLSEKCFPEFKICIA